MSQIKMDSEDIAEIRNALQIIEGNTWQEKEYGGNMFLAEIHKQVKRIDRLLPKVAFEGGE